MEWRAVSAIDENIWTEEYLDKVLSSYARRPLPPATQKIGGTTVVWNEIEPGSFVVHAYGGTVDDKTFVRCIVGSQLKAYGMKPAIFTFTPDDTSKTSSWQDIQDKAQRIRTDAGSLANGRRILMQRNGNDIVVATVEGDTDTYQSEFSLDDPTSGAITTWQCECAWDQFAWQRTRKWKPLEGRPCAHVLAAYWESVTAPKDEEFDPSSGAAIGPGGQMGFGAPEMAPTGLPGASKGPRAAPAPPPPLSLIHI